MDTLQQRINHYLRENAPIRYMQVTESSKVEYDLQRAENELRAAQERLDRIKNGLGEPT